MARVKGSRIDRVRRLILHTNTHTYIHIYIHTYIHTHTYTKLPAPTDIAKPLHTAAAIISPIRGWPYEANKETRAEMADSC